jgi:alpha-tubulin suppressor-like RCC1 family protein
MTNSIEFAKLMWKSLGTDAMLDAFSEMSKHGTEWKEIPDGGTVPSGHDWTEINGRKFSREPFIPDPNDIRSKRLRRLQKSKSTPQVKTVPLPDNSQAMDGLSAFGDQHSIHIQMGSVVLMGRNDCGQLGLPANEVVVFSPHRFEAEAVQVSSGPMCSGYLSNKGDFFITGRVPFPPNLLYKFTLIASDVEFISCGHNLIAFIDSSRKLYVTTFENNIVFGDVPIESVQCGLNHLIALDSEGNVWGYGLNEYGQLATTESMLTKPTIIATDITSISTGYFHSLFVNSKGRLLFCGRDPAGALSGKEKHIHTLMELGEGEWQESCSYKERILAMDKNQEIYQFTWVYE